MIAELIERLTRLGGPDREVDYAIFRLFAEKERANIWDPKQGHQYTASLDAAIALVERKLPGQEWSCGSTREGVTEPWGKVRVAPLHSIQEVGATPAIALLIALLRALEGQE